MVIPIRDIVYRAPDKITPRVVLDFETNEGAINGDLSNVWCLVMYFPDTYDFDLYTEEQLKDEETLESIQGILNSHCAVIHNAKFDLWVAAQIGLKIECYECTQVLAYCLNPGQPTGLAALAKKYNLEYQKTEHTDFSQYSEEMGEYCLNDCKTTWSLYSLLSRQLDEPGLSFLYYSVEMPFVLNILEMELTGITVDKHSWLEAIQKLETEQKRILTEIHAIIPLAPSKSVKTKNSRPEHQVCTSESLELGKYVYDSKDDSAGYTYLKVEEFNPNSTLQASWALEHLYGWESPETTPSGKPKLDREVLEECPYPLAQLLVKYGEIQKILSTYGRSLMDRVKEDGRLYGSFNQCVTRTGRLSSSNPNLQNIPGRGEMGDVIRNLFVASPDHLLVGCDVDSFQVRILCYYQNAILRNEYPDAGILYDQFLTNPDTDPHQVRADIIGCERKIAKNCLFGDLFGFGVAKFAAMSGLSIPKAQAILEQQRENSPSIQALKDAVWEYTRLNDGVIVDLFGRRGVYPEINIKKRAISSRAERQSFNFLIQSTEASIIKMWLNLIRSQLQLKGLSEVKILMQIHDEILLECPPERVAEVESIVQSCLQTPNFLGELPVTGTPEHGKSWYEVHA